MNPWDPLPDVKCSRCGERPMVTSRWASENMRFYDDHICADKIAEMIKDTHAAIEAAEKEMR